MKHFLRNEAGQFAVSLACVLTLLMGGVGGAVDLVVYNNHRAQLQDTADAAVLAAAREATLKGWSVERAREIAGTIVNADLANKFSASATFGQKMEINEQLRRVDLTLTQDHFGYFFLGYFTGSPQISVHATAAAVGQSNICIVVQSNSAPHAFELSGNALVAAADCSAYSNSTDVRGITARNSARLRSDFVCSVGGFAGAPRNYEPMPLTDCPALGDPLAARAAAIDAWLDGESCTENKIDIKNASKSLSPGTYCGDINISDESDVTLKSGIYVINGKLRVDKVSSISGNGVSLVFVGDKAGLEFKHDSTVSLTAPKDGALAGILVYARPMGQGGGKGSAGSGKTRPFKIESEDAGKLIGTVYLPGDTLVVGGDKDADGLCDIDSEDANEEEVQPAEACDSDVGTASAWTAIVVEELKVTNGAKLVLNADYSSTTIPVPEGLGPTSSIRLAR